MLNTVESQKTDELPAYRADAIVERGRREEIRTELAKLEEEAFKDDPRRYGINLISELPDSMYFNKSNILIILENDDTREIHGFTFLERQGDSYYQVITCIKHQGRGDIKLLLKRRDEEMLLRGVHIVTTHVDKGSKYEQVLREHYEQLSTEGMEEASDDKQVALRYKIPSQ